MERLHSLDYLRGITAFAIMLFHYLTWTVGEFDSSSILGRIGLYGVSVFYILSGLTLFHVFRPKLFENPHSVSNFFLKRFLRIMPLLWLTTFLSIILFHGKDVLFKDIFLNFTGLFGFVDWSGGLGIGVWSIGNEIVFYTLFPLLVFLDKKSPTGLYIFVALGLLAFIYFSQVLLQSNGSLTDSVQRSYYMNPFNQFFLFLSGYIIGRIFQFVTMPQSGWFTLLITFSFIFIFYPVTGDRIHLVQGTTRLILVLCSIAICLSIYKLKFMFTPFIARTFSHLGAYSYSIYLLHPIVHRFTGKIITYTNEHIYHLPETVHFIVAVGGTLICSHFVYNYFELFFMRLGKRKPPVQLAI